MVNVILERYFGDVNVTKSKLRIVRDDGAVLFECEARELGFVDFADTERRMGTMYKCHPRGVFPLKVVTLPFNEACLKTHHTRTHRGTVIYGDFDTERKMNAIIIGFADDKVAARRRQLVRKDECREEFNRVVGMLWGEEFRLVVENE